MLVIQEKSDTLINIVRKQCIADGKTYRLLVYCLEQECPEGLLLYNTLSCEMVLLEGEETVSKLALPYLIENWFVVPEDFDDHKLASEYRTIRELLLPKETDTCAFTILTTTDCNARCFYCYELGRSRIMMTEDTALKVADYVIGCYRSLPDDKKVDMVLNWFGGEPLYNSRAIDIICQRLAEAQVPYKSRMISNAYLFDNDLVQKAVSLWKLKRVQVTLDGTEETYNRSKAFIYTEGSAFQRVMESISLLLASDVRVVVRMNMDMHNAEDLKSLAYQLKERFADSKYLECYSHPLFEVASPVGHVRSEERRSLVYSKQKELVAILEDLGLMRIRGRLLKDIPFNYCMADNGRSVVIAPTGEIGLCEHYSESEFFSHIDTPEQRDEAVVASFRERCDELALCHDCPVYPQCIRLKKCEENSLCFPEIRAEKEENIRKAMLAKYESWKAKEEETETAAEPHPDPEDDDTLQNC